MGEKEGTSGTWLTYGNRARIRISPKTKGGTRLSRPARGCRIPGSHYASLRETRGGGEGLTERGAPEPRSVFNLRLEARGLLRKTGRLLTNLRIMQRNNLKARRCLKRACLGRHTGGRVREGKEVPARREAALCNSLP